MYGMEKFFTGIEIFDFGVSKNIQVAVYDAETLEYKYSIPWNAESGQVEVSGLTVDKIEIWCGCLIGLKVDIYTVMI